jgi:Skp family chaperone for outer membrane proteins
MPHTSKPAAANAVLAIRRVAEEQGLDLVLQDMVYIRPERDITDKVIERLGKAP